MSARRFPTDAASVDAAIVAIPLAAGLTLALARWLPVAFEYHENAFGIVSYSTVRRYPLQQETFWLVFAALVGALLCWLLSRAFAREALPPRTQATAEAFAALGVVAALWLPGIAGTIGCIAAAVAALHGVRRAKPSPVPEPVISPPPAPRSSTLRRCGLAVFALLLGALLTPPIWVCAWNFVHAVPDVQLVSDFFPFQAELGQHLAWADSIRRGGLHGRDFFCLYGPLYDMGLAAAWALTRRSLATANLYLSFGRVVAYASTLLLCAALVRRKLLVLLLPLALVWVDLRVALALAGLLLLTLWLRDRRRSLTLAAGLVGGIAVLYSQEFGFAFLVSAAAAFAITREGKAAAAFVAGLSLPLVLVLGWFAINGALAPMLHDLVQYPRYMLAGYGKLPFPSLVANLPLRLSLLLDPEGAVDLGPITIGAPTILNLRLGYTAPFICAGSLLLAFPLASLRALHPLAWLRATADQLARDPLRLATSLVALFGVIAFRSALGRSDIAHIAMVLAPSVLLVVIGIDRLIGAWRADPARRPIVATRAVALCLLVAHGGFLEYATPLRSLRYSLNDIATLASAGHAPRGSRHTQEVWRWVLSHTQPDDPVLFLPDVAAYYYLTRRPSPTRFVVGHQTVTDAHRAEALAALRARPPRYVVWDDTLVWVDEIDPRVFLGRAISDWIDANYVEETRVGQARMLRWQGAPAEPGP